MNHWFAPGMAAGPVNGSAAEAHNGKAGCCACRATPRSGLIERKYELARAYLDSPPAQLAVVAAA
jgi:hypothetical protein